jgi:hypothetical protein
MSKRYMELNLSDDDDDNEILAFTISLMNERTEEERQDRVLAQHRRMITRYPSCFETIHAMSAEA